MISALWPMPQKISSHTPQLLNSQRDVNKTISLQDSFDPFGQIPFPKPKLFDSSPYLDLYNKLDAIVVEKAGFPTVKGTIEVTASQLPQQIFQKDSFPATIQKTAEYFGLPSQYIASITVEISQDFLKTSLYTVTIERYLSDYGEPF